MAFGATIAIIDTGFDLDHDYLRPKVLANSEEETIDFQGWDFFDNSHMKNPVITDKSSIQEILLFRNIRAKGHRQGLSLEEFNWFKKKSADKEFMEKVRLFRKQTHGTFVAGIALREGENISIFPIRGLNIPTPVVAVEDTTVQKSLPLKAKTQEEKFKEEIKNSLDRVSSKFSKICRFVANKKIEVVNASYGITYKSMMNKFRERYKEFMGKEIEPSKLKYHVDEYFRILYERGEKTMRRYPNVLFVFSAGNSGLSNDEYHHYPSKIKVPNAISVAAMNGEYLATFSNYGATSVDIGAPGVAILSILPKVYTQDGNDKYSPASGTSMAAPYVANLAAQILNTNPSLTPVEIKQIIMETGEVKEHLRTRLASSAVVNNQHAIRAALLSKDLSLDQAIVLGKSDLIPMEDSISIGKLTPSKILESIPSAITPHETDEEPEVTEASTTKSESSLPKGPAKAPQDKKDPLPSEEKALPEKSPDPVPSSQTEELSPPPSEEKLPSSSEPEPQPPETESPGIEPSSP